MEITAQILSARATLSALEHGGALARLMRRQARAFAADENIAERYSRDCPGLPRDVINVLHDPLAVAVA